MTNNYKPDYHRIVRAARNNCTDYIPLYEHNVDLTVIEQITDTDLQSRFYSKDENKLDEYFKIIGEFHSNQGYDVYSFEGCFTQLIQKGKGLTGEAGPLFQNDEDLLSFPWDDLTDRYFELFKPYFDSIRRTMIPGMKIVGGVGNGVFETIQDFIPYTELAYLEIDNPDMFSELWKKVGKSLYKVWVVLLNEYSDILAVGRFGDDLGFKSAPLLSPQNIVHHIIPQYKKIIKEVKSRNIPFLLHSCGAIFDVMDDLIDVGIDAKHSNEDAIAPFQQWVDDYGQKIGNFGGLDMDIICRESDENIRIYIQAVMANFSEKSKGLAIGTGNQIASYVPPQNFLTMVDEIRKIREA